MKIVEFKPFENTDGKVSAYLHTPITEMEIRREKYPCVVICPGGAYAFCSQREHDPVALEYLSAGYNVFILTYSVGDKAKDFTPLMELSKTVMAIRENSDEWGCDSDKIAVCGFSAGGHLAASLATMWNNPELTKRLNTKNGLNKPNGAILSYPVITADEFAHQMSIENVSGAEKGSAGYEFFSLDKRVTDETVPCFLWHTVEDMAVPVENSIKFITALQANKVSFECHIFPTGGHGLSVCTKETGSEDSHNNQWVELSKKWLDKIFDYKL